MTDISPSCREAGIQQSPVSHDVAVLDAASRHDTSIMVYIDA